MKKSVFVFIVALLSICSCINNKNSDGNSDKDLMCCKNQRTEIKKENASIDVELEKKEKDTITLSPDLILNKTFYYITKTDSIDIVDDDYYSGLSGLRFTNDSIINFGIDEFVTKIDSIIVLSNRLIIYYSFTNSSENIVKHSYSNSVFLAPNKLGYIYVGAGIMDEKLEPNHTSLMVDSVYAQDIIVKGEEYDLTMDE